VLLDVSDEWRLGATLIAFSVVDVETGREMMTRARVFAQCLSPVCRRLHRFQEEFREKVPPGC
jgi:hypothetical protein